MILCTYTSKLFETLDLVRIDPYLHKFKHNFIFFLSKRLNAQKINKSLADTELTETSNFHWIHFTL